MKPFNYKSIQQELKDKFKIGDKVSIDGQRGSSLIMTITGFEWNEEQLQYLALGVLQNGTRASAFLPYITKIQ